MEGGEHGGMGGHQQGGGGHGAEQGGKESRREWNQEIKEPQSV